MRLSKLIKKLKKELKNHGDYELDFELVNNDATCEELELGNITAEEQHYKKNGLMGIRYRTCLYFERKED